MTFLTESRLSVVLARGARKGSFSAHLSGKPTIRPLTRVSTFMVCGRDPARLCEDLFSTPIKLCYQLGPRRTLPVSKSLCGTFGFDFEWYCQLSSDSSPSR